MIDLRKELRNADKVMNFHGGYKFAKIAATTTRNGKSFRMVIIGKGNPPPVRVLYYPKEKVDRCPTQAIWKAAHQAANSRVPME